MEQKVAGNKKPEISYLNILFCLLVVFIHVTSNPIAVLQKDSWQYAAVFLPWRLSAFVMQGFIFLSGLRLFLNHGDGIDCKKFYVSRFTKIIIPYVIWNLIYYAYFMRHGYFPFSLSVLLGYMANGTLVSPFYFIVTIVQFYALVPLWQLMVRKADFIYILALSAAVTPVFAQQLPRLLSAVASGYVFAYNDRVFTTYLFYWAAGCFAGARYGSVTRALKKNRRLITGVFAVLAALNAACGYISFTGGVRLPLLETLHYCYCVSAVAFFFAVFTAAAEKRERMNGLLSEIDGASYAIFLSHCLVINIVNDRMAEAGIRSVSVTYFIRIAAVYTVTVAMCVLWNKAKSRLRSFARRRFGA